MQVLRTWVNMKLLINRGHGRLTATMHETPNRGRETPDQPLCRASNIRCSHVKIGRLEHLQSHGQSGLLRCQFAETNLHLVEHELGLRDCKLLRPVMGTQLRYSLHGSPKSPHGSLVHIAFCCLPYCVFLCK